MRKHSRRILLSLTALFVLLMIANLWCFFSREWESTYYPADYATLYYPLDVPTICEWKQKSLYELQPQIAMHREVDEWQVTCDGGPAQTSHGKNPTIKLLADEGVFHSYTLTPLPKENGADIRAKIRFYSSKFYKDRGLKHNDVYTIKTDVPCGKFKQYSVSDWVDDYHYVGEEGLAELDRILAQEVGIRPEDSTFLKLEKLTRYLRIKLLNARGVPKDDFRWMNPWLIFKEMVAGTGKGWCTQHAQIWVLFANRAGVPTRLLLGARTEGNTFFYSGHTWAECYIKEQNRWAFADLSHSLAYITDKNGLVLNTVELFHLSQHDAFDGTVARIYKDWEWTNLPVEADADSMASPAFSLCKQVFTDEFPTVSIIKYRRPPNVEDIRTIYSGFFKDATYLWGNLQRYLFKPPLAYSFYQTEGKQTFFIRWALFYSMIAVLIVMLVGIFSRFGRAQRA